MTRPAEVSEEARAHCERGCHYHAFTQHGMPSCEGCQFVAEFAPLFEAEKPEEPKRTALDLLYRIEWSCRCWEIKDANGVMVNQGDCGMMPCARRKPGDERGRG